MFPTPIAKWQPLNRNLYRIVRQAEWVDEEVYRWYYRRLADGYSATLEHAMERGQLRPLQPELTAYCLMGMADFIGMRYCLWAEEGPSDAQIEAILTLVTAGLAAPGAAPTTIGFCPASDSVRSTSGSAAKPAISRKINATP